MTAMSEVVFGGGTRLETVYNRFDLANVFVIASHSQFLSRSIETSVGILRGAGFD